METYLPTPWEWEAFPQSLYWWVWHQPGSLVQFATNMEAIYGGEILLNTTKCGKNNVEGVVRDGWAKSAWFEIGEKLMDASKKHVLFWTLSKGGSG